MAVKTEQVEKNLVKVVFEVSAEDFEKAINKVYQKNKNKYNIPGFRKGKAPMSVVEKLYSPAVFYDEAVNMVLPEAYEAAVKEAELDVVARPEIDVDGEIKKGEKIVFTALVTTKPEVKLGDYKGIEVEKVEYTVNEEDIDKAIEAERSKNARIVSVDDRNVENGDITVIDFEGFVDGEAFEGGKAEDYELEIGSGAFIPGFEEQIVGASVGVEKEINVKFPEEYHAENLKGKDAMFKVTVKEIKVRELPELDDDFASEVSEFDTLADYKNDVKTKLEKQNADKAKSEIENAIMNKVIENAEFELPEAMIEAQIDRLVSDFSQRLQYQGMDINTYMQYLGTNMEQLRANFKDQAVVQLNGSLVVEAVMKDAGIEVGPEELELNLVDMAKKYNMEIDKLKELISDAEMENIKKDMAMQKTVEMIVNNAVVK